MIYNFIFPFQKSSRYGPPPLQIRLLMKCEILKLNQASIEDVELTLNRGRIVVICLGNFIPANLQFRSARETWRTFAFNIFLIRGQTGLKCGAV